ncbi:MAG: O-antigen ligase family protein [Longimicrobiales bacterium]
MTNPSLHTPPGPPPLPGVGPSQAVGRRGRPRRGKKGKAETQPVLAERLLRYVTRNPRTVVAVGLVLTYVWRWHDFHGLFVALRLAAIFSVLSWLYLIVEPRAGALVAAVKRPYGAFIMLWTVWMLAGVPGALRPDVAWSFWYDIHFKNVLLFLFLAGTLANLKNLQILILANVVGLAPGIFFYMKGGMLWHWTPYSMYDRNDLALLFNMTVPVAVWSGVALKEKWAQAVAWTIAILAVTCIIGTGSRGGLLALAISSLLILVAFEGLSRKAKAAFLAFVAVLLVTAPDAYWDRMRTMLNPSEDYNLTDDHGRVEIWKRAIEYTKQRWTFGVGANNFSVAEVTMRQDRVRVAGARGAVTHNSFLQVAAETGLPGLVFFVGALLTSLWALVAQRRRLRKTRDDRLGNIAQLTELVALCLIAFIVGGFFLSQAYFSYLMVLFAIVAALEYVGEREIRAWKAQKAQARAHAAALATAHANTHVVGSGPYTRVG